MCFRVDCAVYKKGSFPKKIIVLIFVINNLKKWYLRLKNWNNFYSKHSISLLISKTIVFVFLNIWEIITQMVCSIMYFYFLLLSVNIYVVAPWLTICLCLFIDIHLCRHWGGVFCWLCSGLLYTSWGGLTSLQYVVCRAIRRTYL